MIKKFSQFTSEEMKDIISRINPINHQYYQYIKECESASNHLIFLDDYAVDNILHNKYVIKNYKDLIFSYFSYCFNGAWGFSNYSTYNITLDADCNVRYTYHCYSEMRSFEDVLNMVLTYFPETTYLEVFETLLSFVKLRTDYDGQKLYGYFDFFFCDDIERINLLRSEDRISLGLDYILKYKLRYINNSSEEYDQWESSENSINSLNSWRNLLDEYLTFKGWSEDDLKDNFEQVIVTEEFLRKEECKE